MVPWTRCFGYASLSLIALTCLRSGVQLLSSVKFVPKLIRIYFITCDAVVGL